MPIAHRLHHMWLNEAEPNCSEAPMAYPRYREYIAGWKQHHATFEYHFWNETNTAELWDNPKLRRWAGFFRQLRYRIERCDFTRYAIMHVYGGLYVDLDYVCRRSFLPLFEGRELLLTEEPAEHDREGVRFVANSVMASAPGHPFWARLMDDIMAHYETTLAKPNANAVATTGPQRVALSLSQHPKLVRQPQPVLVDTCLLLPLSFRGMARACPADALEKAYCYTRWGEGTGWLSDYRDKIVSDNLGWILIPIMLVVIALAVILYT